MTGAIGMVANQQKYQAPPSQIKIYGRRLFFWDVVVVSGVMAMVSAFFYYGLPVVWQTESTGDLRIQMNPITLATTIYGLYLLFLVIYKTWNTTIAGAGIPEYVVMAQVSLNVLATLAAAALLFKLDVSRLYVLNTILAVTVALIMHRWIGRQWLIAQRKRNKFMLRTGIIGPANQIAEMVPRLRNNFDAGYDPQLAAVFKDDFTPKKIKELEALGLTVVNYETAKLSEIEFAQLQVAMVLGSDQMDASRIKRLAWGLEGTNIDLVIAPALVDFAGQRISTRNVAGLQFLQVDTPKFSGIKYAIKNTFDFLLGTVLAIIAIPIILIAAIAIKIEDKGPAFFVQQRVGRNGKPFKMLKLRSMFVGAEELHEEMKRKANKSPNTVLYKNPEDPRITKVGKFIRRYSIDELPQLFNVLAGHMSLVGPRPPLLSEVNAYELDMMRRLLVKPGLTGLWQTSGRATLSFEESMRLDLTYVENWSIMGDLMLLLRTVKAVLTKSGS